MEICNRYLIEIIKLLEVDFIIALGLDVKKELSKFFEDINYLAHPSPLSLPSIKKKNFSSWNDYARNELENLNLLQYFI